jgi:hypothetical protein
MTITAWTIVAALLWLATAALAIDAALAYHHHGGKY